MGEAEGRTGNPLGWEKPSALLRKFSIPSVIAMLVSSLYNIIDQIFIGQGIGFLGNAATNVAYPLTTISLAISLLIGVGCSAFYSLALGRGDKKAAELCVGNAFWMSVVLGVLYLVLGEFFAEPLTRLFGATENVLPLTLIYVRITLIGMPPLIFSNVLSKLIRADGDPRFSMLSLLAGTVLNTILDPIFIFVLFNDSPESMIAGAAIATVISQFVSMLLCATYLRRFKQVKLGRDFFRPKLSGCIKAASLGISNSLNQVSVTVMQIIVNNSLTYYGAMTIYGADIPLSAFGIAMKVNGIFISVMVGIHQGAQPILGYNYGAHQYERVKAVWKLGALICLGVGVLSFITFQCFPEAVVHLFGSGSELYYEFASRFIRIFLFTSILNGVQLLCANFFATIGKPLKGVVLVLLRQFVLIISLVLILPLFFGLDGILFAAPISDAIAFIVSILFILHEFRHMAELDRSNVTNDENNG